MKEVRKKMPITLLSYCHNQAPNRKNKKGNFNLYCRKQGKKMLRSLQLDSTYRIILALRLSSTLLIFFSSILSFHGYTTRAHIFIYAGCSQDKYQPNSPFEANLNSFLSSVISSSSEVSYNSFTIGNGSSTPPPEGTTTYGLYQCRGDLKPIECSKCVESSVNQIALVCPNSLGVSLQLEGCYLRYEHFDFLGRLDMSLRYRKFSKALNNEVEFFGRRDDVLSDLQASNNGFRVSTSGFVEGFAQCLGDLTVADCSSCLAEAVGKLKSLCGSTAAAEVFLAQCYAQYWESGYYDETDSSKEDLVGKSVAIIVGVLVGLAILVVLLSICRRAMAKLK